MLAVIQLATQPRFVAIDNGLAVAGQSGTLAGRFIGSPLAGKLHAKTGSISGVAGLVGYVAGPDALRFAFIANGSFSTGAGEQLQADVAAAVAATPALVGTDRSGAAALTSRASVGLATRADAPRNCFADL